MNEFKNVEVIEDRDKILFIYPKEIGLPQRIDEFWTIRAGLAWPTVKAPGYYCIIGARDDLSAAEGISLVFIDEGESGVLESLFDKIMINTKRFKCERIYTRLDGIKSPERAYYHFRWERSIDCPGLLDSSEFENFDQDIALIRQWLKKGALKIDSNSCLGNQLSKLKADDVNNDFEINFFAVAAFCRILKSLNVYPFQRRGGQEDFVLFTNIIDRGKSKTDDGYWEITTD